MAKDPRVFKVVVLVSVVEQTGGYATQEMTWHQEQVCVPLSRIAALDPQGMVDRAVRNVVNVAGQDGEEDVEVAITSTPAIPNPIPRASLKAK